MVLNQPKPELGTSLQSFSYAVACYTCRSFFRRGTHPAKAGAEYFVTEFSLALFYFTCSLCYFSLHAHTAIAVADGLDRPLMEFGFKGVFKNGQGSCQLGSTDGSQFPSFSYWLKLSTCARTRLFDVACFSCRLSHSWRCARVHTR